MGDFLNKDLLDSVYGFTGIYGVEIENVTPNFITEEMEAMCNDDIWILVEDNSDNQNADYKYKIKCLCCGLIVKVNDLNNHNVIIPRLNCVLIPYSEIRNYAKNISARYHSRAGKEINMKFLYNKIVENYCGVAN